MNVFLLAYHTRAMKTAEGRARKIATLVAMLARGDTIAPNTPRRTGRKSSLRARRVARKR